MPADASIYNLIRRPQPIDPGPTPFETAGQVMQIRALMGQGQLQDLKRQELERGISERGRLRELFAGGTPTAEQVMAISPEHGLTYQKSLAESQAAQGKLLKQDDDLVKSFAERGRNELLSVTPETWGAYRQLQMDRASLLSTPQYRQTALQALQNMPEQYDPNWVRAKLAEGVTPPAGHTMLPGGGLSPADPNYIAGRQAISADKLAELQAHNLEMERMGGERMQFETGIPFQQRNVTIGQPAAPVPPAAPVSPVPAQPAPAVPAAPAQPAPGMTPKAQAELAAKRAEDKPKDVKSLRSLIPSLQRMRDEAQAILNDPNLGFATGANYLLGNVPSTAAYDVAQRVETLKAQTFGNVITAMREASKTGGLVGNMSDAEGARFERMVASLERAQTDEAFVNRLQQIVNYTQELERQAITGFKDTYGAAAPEFPRSTTVVDRNKPKNRPPLESIFGTP